MRLKFIGSCKFLRTSVTYHFILTKCLALILAEETSYPHLKIMVKETCSFRCYEGISGHANPRVSMSNYDT